MKAKVALISTNPTTHPGKFILQQLSVNTNEVTLKEHIRTKIERRPKLFSKWKTTLIVWKTKTTSTFWEEGKQPQFETKIKDILNLKEMLDNHDLKKKKT